MAVTAGAFIPNATKRMLSGVWSISLRSDRSRLHDNDEVLRGLRAGESGRCPMSSPPLRRAGREELHEEVDKHPHLGSLALWRAKRACTIRGSGSSFSNTTS